MKKLPIYNLKNLSKLINTIRKVSKERAQKIPAMELHKSKVQVNKKRKEYKTVSNLFRDSLHLDPPSCVATSQLNCHKSQIAVFRKTRDKRAVNLRTHSSNKS